jgi:hypothetical protein
MRSRPVILAAAAVAVLGVSFLLTLWVTRPDVFAACSAGQLRSDAERMAGCPVFSYPDLGSLAEDIGLHRSHRLKGTIDGLSRTGTRSVHMAGWLADPEGDGTPLEVLVFDRGKLVARGRTSGTRADVARAVNLSDEAARNVVLSFDFPCDPGDGPVVVGLGSEHEYLALPAGRCP